MRGLSRARRAPPFALRAASLVLLLGAASCATGQYLDAAKTHSGRGNHDVAVEFYVVVLQNDPGNAEARQGFTTSLAAAYDQHMSNAQGHARQNHWAEALAEYDRIIALGDLAARAGGERRNVTTERLEAAERAGEAFYQEGERYASSGNAREAARSFRRCVALMGTGFRDAQRLYEQYQREAVVRVAVMPFRLGAQYQSMYANLPDQFATQIVSEVMGERPEFLEFLDREHMEDLLDEQEFNTTDYVNAATAVRIGQLAGVKKMVFGEFTEFQPADSGWLQDRYEDRDHADVRRPDGTVVREEYFAVVYRTYRETSMRVRATFQVTDVETSRIDVQDSVEGNAGDRYEYGRYEGDERALSGNSRELCSRNQGEPRNPDQLVSDLMPGLVSQMATRLRRAFQ